MTWKELNAWAKEVGVKEDTEITIMRWGDDDNWEEEVDALDITFWGKENKLVLDSH